MKRESLRTFLAVLVLAMVGGQGCPMGGLGWSSADDNSGGAPSSGDSSGTAASNDSNATPNSDGGGGPSISGCDNGAGFGVGVERIGVLQSTDGGVTWTFLGHACLHAPGMIPVDPAPRCENGRVVLYFYDLAGQNSGQSGVTHVMYRAESVSDDYLEFTAPTAAYSTTQYSMTDPDVALLPDGTYRMYVSVGSVVPSASSEDGVTFTADEGERSQIGGVPGALVLPDGRVRLFVCGNGGIVSLISDDGLEFVSEPGVRISAPDAEAICDPDPIQLQDGSYMMVYKIRPAGQMGANSDQVYLATSTDGLNWTTTGSPIVTGSVPGLVQLDDGTLLIYYVDFGGG